jgi:transcriptional regulator with XRE-family HTH domain
VEQAAQQLLRAIRGHRSQIAFARRLGYRRNPICDWEHGRRYPTAVEALRAARVVGLDLDGAFQRFATLEAPPPSGYDAEALAAWLERLRGTTPIGEVAERAGVSRFAASRWLSGATRPRLPDFLRLVDALTRRLSDWVAALVPIEQVPALTEDFARRQDGRRLAVEVPWSEGVLRLLETEDYAALPAHRPGWLAERLGIAPEVEARCVDALAGAGAIAWDGARYRSARPLLVDTASAPEVVAALKGHWARVGWERTQAPRAGDLLSYNVISLSRADLQRLRELHLGYFREVRALVAASEPVEVAALVNVQLVTFGGRDG